MVIHVINLNCFDKLDYMMQMDARKRWMYDVDRRTSEYMAALKKFLDVAEANRVNNFMPCPCVECRNVKGYSKRSYPSWPPGSAWFHAQLLLLDQARRKRGYDGRQ